MLRILFLIAMLLLNMESLARVNVCSRSWFIRNELEQILELPCQQINEDHLASLTELYFYQTSLAVLKKGDFEGLKSLRTLKISGKQIAELPDGVFDPLIKLEALDLSVNKIRSLPENIFSKLERLQRLDLQSNELKELSAASFHGMRSINTLILDLIITDRQFPRDLFSQLYSLKSLYLFLSVDRSINIPLSFDSSTFKGLAQLTKLWFKSGNIKIEFPSDIFKPLPQLSFLHLESCLNWSQVDFYQLKSLKELEISSRDNSSSDQYTFSLGFIKNVTGLERIKIYETYPLMINNGDLSGLYNLKSLDLRTNTIQSLPQGSLTGLINLELLDLSINNLESIPEDLFRNTPKLVSILLQNNKVNGIDSATFHDLPHLTVLNLTRNSIRKINSEVFNPNFFSKKANVFILSENLLDGESVHYLETQLEGRFF